MIAVNGRAIATTPTKTTMLDSRITTGFIKIPTSDTTEKLFATRGSVAKVEAIPTNITPINEFTALNRVEQSR